MAFHPALALISAGECEFPVVLDKIRGDGHSKFNDSPCNDQTKKNVKDIASRPKPVKALKMKKREAAKLAQLELRNILMDKARTSICQKLAELKIAASTSKIPEDSKEAAQA